MRSRSGRNAALARSIARFVGSSRGRESVCTWLLSVVGTNALVNVAGAVAPSDLRGCAKLGLSCCAAAAPIKLKLKLNAERSDPVRAAARSQPHLAVA